MQFLPFLGFLMVALPYAINAAPIAIDTLANVPIEIDDSLNDLEVEILNILSKRLDTLAEIPIEIDESANDIDVEILEILRKRVDTLANIPIDIDDSLNGLEVEVLEILSKRLDTLADIPINIDESVNDAEVDIISVLDKRVAVDTLLDIPINIEDSLNDLNVEILEILKKRGDEVVEAVAALPACPTITEGDMTTTDALKKREFIECIPATVDETTTTETGADASTTVEEIITQLRKRVDTLLNIPINIDESLNDANLSVLEILSRRGIHPSTLPLIVPTTEESDEEDVDEDMEEGSETLINIPISLGDVLNGLELDILSILSRRDELVKVPVKVEDSINDAEVEVLEILS